jgi:hypothetical protein
MIHEFSMTRSIICLIIVLIIGIITWFDPTHAAFIVWFIFSIPLASIIIYDMYKIKKK